MRGKVISATREVGIKVRERKTTRLLDTGFNNLFLIHNLNFSNSLRGIVERVLFRKDGDKFVPPPEPARGAWKHPSLSKFRKLVCARVGPTPRVDYEGFLGYYTGRKLARYKQAVESLKILEVERQDAIIDLFVKAEKINFTTKKDPPPRVIQPRNPRYNVEVGRFIKPVEHRIYGAIDSIFGARVVAKGKNAIERAAMLREAWEKFNDPVAVFLDVSRFDQCVNQKALEYEHGFYLWIAQNHPLLQTLLAWQVDNVGYCRCEDGKIKYKVKGCRMSGDMNTALGNVILMCALMYAYLQEFVPDAALVDDGDDCVVILERGQYHKLIDTCGPWFLDRGFVMKYEGMTDIFEKIEFCQTQPIFDGEKWVMCRDPRVCIDKDLVSVTPRLDEKSWRKHCSAVALCGLALAGNLPVYCAFYSMLDQGEKVERALETGMDYLALGMEGSRRPVHEEARMSFYRAFDIIPDDQTALETFYDGMPVHFSGCPRDYNEEISKISPHLELLLSN
jgi:hypothetical protein